MVFGRRAAAQFDPQPRGEIEHGLRPEQTPAGRAAACLKGQVAQRVRHLQFGPQNPAGLAIAACSEGEARCS